MEEIFDIASKRISGIVLSSAEELALADWLSYAENKQLYNELQKVWQLTGKLSYQLKPDVDIEWDLFRCLVPDKKIKRLNKKLIYSFSSIAATLILFFGIWGATQIISSKEVQYFSANEVQQIQLPDQSIVHLNKHSQLTVDKKFNKRNRNVSLSGEALFEVTENKETPFIVSTDGGVQAKVLGTHFNLKANSINKEISVNVFSGKVMFGIPKTENTVLVYKGQQASYNITKEYLSEPTELNPNAISWKTKDFQFDNSPIVEVVYSLGELIGKQLVLPTNSEQIRYSGSFNNPTEQQVAEVIGLAMGWDYKITDKAVLFSVKK